MELADGMASEFQNSARFVELADGMRPDFQNPLKNESLLTFFSIYLHNKLSANGRGYMLLDEKIVAILRGVDPGKLPKLVSVLYESGIKAIEVTLNSPGALDSIAELAEEYEGRALIGAGTVTTAEEAEAALDAGAQFIVSPILSEAVIQKTKERGAFSVPAAFTPTEVFQAMEFGADLVKLFPASAVGPDYIKALQGPFVQLPIMVTGGVTLDNIGTYFAAGVTSVGLGSSLTAGDALAKGDWDKVRSVIKEYESKVKEG